MRPSGEEEEIPLLVIDLENAVAICRNIVIVAMCNQDLVLLMCSGSGELLSVLAASMARWFRKPLTELWMVL